MELQTTTQPAGALQPSAFGALEKATIEAGIMQALARPRSLAQFDADLMEACEIEGFAEDAVYKKPGAGKTLIGPSVALYRYAATVYKNLRVQARVLPSSNGEGHIRCEVHDLENNVFTVAEHRFPLVIWRGGERIDLSKATHSNVGNDIRNLTQLNIGFTERKALSGLLPRFMIDKAFKRCRAIKIEKAERSLEGEGRQRMAENVAKSFKAIGVSIAELEDYLGNPLKDMTAAQLDDLKTIGSSIKQGEISKDYYFGKSKAQQSDSASDLEKEVEREMASELTEEEMEAKMEAAGKEAEAAAAEAAEQVDTETGEITPAAEGESPDPEAGTLWQDSEKPDYD